MSQLVFVKFHILGSLTLSGEYCFLLRYLTGKSRFSLCSEILSRIGVFTLFSVKTCLFLERFRSIFYMFQFTFIISFFIFFIYLFDKISPLLPVDFFICNDKNPTKIPFSFFISFASIFYIQFYMKSAIFNFTMLHPYTSSSFPIDDTRNVSFAFMKSVSATIKFSKSLLFVTSKCKLSDFYCYNTTTFFVFPTSKIQ